MGIGTMGTGTPGTAGAHRRAPTRRVAASCLKAMKAIRLLLLCTAVWPSGARAQADDWPSFRGPAHNGSSPETGLLENWPDSGPTTLWQASMGGGFSGVTATGGRVFTLYSRGGRELAAGFDAETGEALWSTDIDHERKDRFGDGPRSTPPVNGGILYAVSGLGKMHALEAAGGKRLWSRDLHREFGARVPEFGVSASPIVEGDLLLFNVGGKRGHAIMAFDKVSGEVVWSAESDLPGYASPVTFTVGGVRHAVFFTGSSVVALDPLTGASLWKHPWKTAYDINAASPIFIAPDKLFVSSGHDTGAALFRIVGAVGGAAGDGPGTASATIVWKTRDMRNHFSSSVYVEGNIYGFDNKNFKCIDAETGEDRWRKGRLGHGSLFYADGHLLVLSEDGRLVLVKATPKAYTEEASHQVADAKHWTVPTLYRGRLYVRNERDLYCLDLKS